MRLSLLLVCLPALIMTSPDLSAASPRTDPWREVDDAIARGLPQTAIERLAPIAAGALRDQAWAEAAKAIARRVVLESQIQGRRPEERVRRFVQALADAPPVLQPVFHALVAHAFWGYFEENRWRIQQRTASSGPDSTDFETWDLKRLFTEIDRQFQLAIANARLLQAVPIADFDDLLEEGTLPDRARPTLYDFLVHQAIEFYAAGEQAGARPQDAFVLRADSPIFASTAEFLAWNPVTPDTNAVALKATRLFQDLIRFHLDDTDRTALLDVDLARLRYGGNVAVGPDKEARQLAALRLFVDQARDHEWSALARHDAARLLVGQDKPAEAHALASEAVRQFPESPGGRLCRNLILEIEASSHTISTERIWNAPWPDIEVNHKNLTGLWLRAIASEWDQFLDRRRNRPEQLNRDERLALLRQTPVRQWSQELPPTPDYRSRTTRLPVPSDLPPGFYFIISSRNADFSTDDNDIRMTPVWVSDLALVVRTRAGQWEGWVLDARTGVPLQGARVEAWFLGQRGERGSIPARTTDEAGLFSFPRPREGRAYLFKASHHGQSIAMADDLWWGGPPEPPRTDERTVFFTDRRLYRPGQLIQYKGICLTAAPASQHYETLADRRLVVVLRDPNGRELERQSHRANDYGSFSGTFTAPRDAVTGAFQLQVEGEPSGATSVQIEEYKRPKFEVTLDAPVESPRLGERVSLAGRGTAYTGAAIDGAQVTWRVVRLVRFPPWFSWFRGGWPTRSSSQEIAHGTTTTDPQGSFTIEFPALPDPGVDESDAPIFQFSVHADVTDGAGETRSAERTLPIGYTALTAELTAEPWQDKDTPVALQILTRTLDEQPAPAKGTLKIHRLRAPDQVVRAPLSETRPRGAPTGNPAEPPDLSDPRNWELAAVVAEQSFTTSTNGVVTNRFELDPGFYRAVLTTSDRFGRPVTAQLPLQVLDTESGVCPLRVPSVVTARKESLEPGEELVLLWGTGYSAGRAFIEVEHQNSLRQRFWTDPNRTQHILRVPVTETMRGGFTVHVTYVRENRIYQESRHIDVPWSNKEFELTWETFRSRLEPAQQETWTAVIRPRRPGGADSVPVEHRVAEMVATLYDASLDQMLPFDWPTGFGCFPSDYSTARVTFANDGRSFQQVVGNVEIPYQPVDIRYRRFPSDLVERGGMRAMTFNRGRFRGFGGGAVASAPSFGLAAAMPAAAPAALAEQETSLGFAADRAGAEEAVLKGDDAARDSTSSSGLQTTPRKNLQETAFFLPHLLSDSNGVVRLTFTLPEALTEWRFLGFAHDTLLRAGLLEGRTVTARDLMVQPNPPRFLREGDVIEFSAKVLNQSSVPQSGRVRLDLRFAFDDSPANQALGLNQPELAFEVPPKESRSVSWQLRVPDGCGFLTFKVTAASARLSDGEEGHLPVLSRRILVTESLPLPIRGPADKTFDFASLRQSADSPTVRHQGLTVQMASNPAWYAVLALPYLMEFPHECSEQIFNRLYANSLARHIAASNPRIKAVFDQWRGTPVLASPLEKNPELLAVALEETPWLRQANNESAARRNVALLFEDNRLQHEVDRTLRKLAEIQLVDGGWPWFPGGPHDDFVTLYIVTGFGRLQHLGVEIPLEAALKALPGLDAWMQERWQRLADAKRLDQVNLDPMVALCLYGRSFFLTEAPIAEPHRAAFDYWIDQARQHWLKLNHRLPQGHLALALHRCGNRIPRAASVDTPQAILRSLRERSVRDEELGRFWREDERSWSWFRAPIETQALMIELFEELGGDAAFVEDLKVWLLKQKQTQDWKTTKATADAVYALLLRGTGLLASTRPVEVQLGDRHFPPISDLRSPNSGHRIPIEPGTGFYEARLPAAEVDATLARITVRKVDPGIAWGGVHWQYFEDVSRVRAYAGTPLTLTKALFTRVNTREGQRLVPVSGPVHVGNELVVRVELRVDRDMEYVHLKDQRGSGTEPVNVLSRYRFQDGLGYYESTRDTASHFFISYLPKGTYVFEYPLRVQHRGSYATGIATVQCMYAPEFNSHSGSISMVVD